MFGRERRISPDGIIIAVIVILFLWLVSVLYGQNAVVQDGIARSKVQKLEADQVLKSAFSEYRGIAIGTTEVELLERIETKPTFESKDDYVFVFSDDESAQFLLDEGRKVKVISVTYSGDDSRAPTYGEVFGIDAPIKMTPEGKVYNLVNYPEAGFWVAYYKSTGEYAIVSITIQKL